MSRLRFFKTEFFRKNKQTRPEFLSEKDRRVPCDYLAGELAKHCPQEGAVGRQPIPVEMMLRIHFMQQRFNMSDPVVQQASYDSISMRQFDEEHPGGASPRDVSDEERQ